MKYDVKTSEMAFFLIMSRKCMSKCFCFKYFIFVRQIIEQTNVNSKILELLVITLGTDANVMLYECSKWHWPIYCVSLMSKN